MVVSLSSPPPAYQLTPIGLCHFTYISSESELTNICHGPFPPQSLQFGSLLSPHFVQKLDRDGSVPYTDLTRNDTLTWSFLHGPSLINFHPGKTHFTEAPCSPSSVALVFRWSSSVPNFSLKHISAPLCYCCLWPCTAGYVLVFPIWCHLQIINFHLNQLFGNLN